MKRRAFVQLAAVASLLALPGGVRAWSSCGPFTINGAKYCYAGLRSPLVHVPAAAIDGRDRTSWCWAACVEMLFRYHGYSIDQQRIVTASWGSISAVPTAAERIVAGLDRDWIDANGRSFRAAAELLPVNPGAAAAILGQDVPLVLVTPTHPVVLTRLRYVGMRGNSGRIQAAEVHDPWPGRAPRRLSQPEWRDAAYLVDLQIS